MRTKQCIFCDGSTHYTLYILSYLILLKEVCCYLFSCLLSCYYIYTCIVSICTCITVNQNQDVMTKNKVWSHFSQCSIYSDAFSHKPTSSEKTKNNCTCVKNCQISEMHYNVKPEKANLPQKHCWKWLHFTFHGVIFAPWWQSPLKRSHKVT